MAQMNAQLRQLVSSSIMTQSTSSSASNKTFENRLSPMFQELILTGSMYTSKSIISFVSTSGTERYILPHHHHPHLCQYCLCWKKVIIILTWPIIETNEIFAQITPSIWTCRLSWCRVCVCWQPRTCFCGGNYGLWGSLTAGDVFLHDNEGGTLSFTRRLMAWWRAVLRMWLLCFIWWWFCCGRSDKDIG